MEDETRALAVIEKLVPQLRQWTLDAMQDWLTEHSPESRVKLSRLTRNNYLYDCFYARAEREPTPIPVEVHHYCRMRYLLIRDGDLEVILWGKTVHPKSLLTSSSPTTAAIDRQQSGTLFNNPRRMLFVCGRVVDENIAGSDAWIDRVVITRESRNHRNHRFAVVRRTVYDYLNGERSFQLQYPQLPLVAASEPAAATPKVRVKPRRAASAGGTLESPKVGQAALRRSQEAERRCAEQAESGRRADGSQSA